ncbi:cadherin-like protein 26 isoform X2 [Nerophis ophidion]|uniref:cadherin-like protein 26 isoform X2 n=1 Tax=Nerophis ophidion TaxID=159077 RepID=UPI002ADF2B10|nr:cadherin-like protein 26 isoform X2 [Nerophis ophidion]
MLTVSAFLGSTTPSRSCIGFLAETWDLGAGKGVVAYAPKLISTTTLLLRAGRIKMRTISIPLLAVVMSTLASPRGHNGQRTKRELLARSKRWAMSSIELVEEDPGPYPKPIAQMFNDRIHEHRNHKYVISGMGVTEEPLGVFSIDEQSGKVFAHKPIDREKHAFFHIKFNILDVNTGSKIDRQLAFDVKIQDINDNAPAFLHPRMSVDVSENTPEGLLPVWIEVTDPDEVSTPNSTVSLSVISQSPQLPKMDLHRIDDRLARLNFTGCFDYDKVKMYEIILEAKDHGKPSLSSSAVVTLNIIDSNSHPPRFKAKKYLGEIQEMVTRENVLRLSVDDKDTPKTPAWRAKYFFVEGNEENNYKIETDPETNEGILSVVKGNDFERTTMTRLQVRVENEEALYVCGDPATTSKGFWDTVNITMKVTDVNDPPDFENYTVKVYEKEEQEPGRLLYTPKVLDVDSDISNIRFTKIEDSADWVTIDKKTGQVTTTKKMDRESPFVHDNIYKILLAAIDDGDPPATSTGTVLVHLLDINDNKPKLINTSLTMCGNKFNKVMIAAKDLDSHPYSGPFTVSLKPDDATQLQPWKVDPSTGEEVGLVSLKRLSYGKYTVPLLIEDQQGVSAEDTAVITVCDCRAGNGCHHERLSTSLGAAAIGLIIAGLLLFLGLLLLLTCECRNKFKHGSEVQADEGHQTLIKYNQEGGGSECKTELSLMLTRAKDAAMTFTNGQHPGTLQITQPAPIMTGYLDTHNAGLTQGGSLRSNNNISDWLERRIYMMDRNHPEYQAHDYAYEGEGSACQSLDELSFSNSEEDFHFLNDLGPQFGHLGSICNQMLGVKGTQLSPDKIG